MSADDGRTATISEQTPLLHPTFPRRWPSKLSVASLVIPVAVTARLAVLLPMTTTIDLIHQIVCRIWYAAQDPERTPLVGRVSDPTCTVPDVERYFSAVMTAVTILETIGAMIGYGAVNFFASRHGRKPVMLSVLALYIASLASLLAATLSNGWLLTFFLVLWIILHAVSQSPPMMLVTNMYVIDLIEPRDRTAALSTIAGWTSLGGAPSFTIGGLIAVNLQSASPVYYSAATMVVATMAYIALVLPESFPQEKRQELQRQRASEASAVNENSSPYTKLWMPLEPLKHLKLRRNLHTGGRNWRLVYCAIHVFIANIGDEYATIAVVVFLMTQHGYTPVDTGHVLTAYSVVSVVVLTVLVPFLVRSLRPLYMRNCTSVSRSNSSSRSALPNEEESNVDMEPSDLMDVHITFVSWIIVTLAMIFTGLAVTKTAVVAAILLWGLGAGRRPVFRSLVVTSVDPLKQGEALSAIEMVAGVGAFLSPIVMGSIFTATISTYPQLMFYVHGVIVMAAASFLFLIRDADRYQIAPRMPVQV